MAHEKVKDHACEICGKSFGIKTHLENHIKTVHERIKDFKCELCHKAFASKANLDTHLKTVHNGLKNFGPFSCLISHCPFQGASTAQALSKHMKSHTNCEKCGKIFVGGNAKRDLKNHMKCHDKNQIPSPKEKAKNKCNICNMEFEYKSYLERHMVNCLKKQKIRENLKLQI